MDKVDLQNTIIKENIGWEKRLINFLIDITVIQTISVAVHFLVIVLEKDSTANTVTYEVDGKFFFIPVYFLYYIVCEFMFSKTLGKLVTKTKVAKSNGEKLDFDHAILRTFLRLNPLNPITILFGNLWHDKFSSTQLVSHR